MHPAAHWTRVALGLVCALVCASTAKAQTSGYIAGAVFADVKQFSSTISQPVILGSSLSMDATGVGGSLRIGTWLHPRWTLEVGADAGNRTAVGFENPVVIAIFPPPRPLHLKSTSSFVSVSTLVGFHPPSIGRLRLGYLAGFSLVRATYKSDYPGFSLPGPIFEFDGGFAYATLGSYTSSSISSLPIRLNPATLTQKHNTGALVLGFEAAIDLTTTIAVVPELRAFTFSTPGAGAGVFLIRPGVGVRWKF